MVNKKEILRLLTSIKYDMNKLHNIDYSQAYLDLIKAIKLIENKNLIDRLDEIKQPIRKIGIGVKK